MVAEAMGFWRELRGALAAERGRAAPWLATVTELVDGLVIVRPEGLPDAAALELARVAGVQLAVNDRVIVLGLPATGDGDDVEGIVLGKVQNTSPAGFAFEAPLTGIMLRETNAASAATTASTSNTTTFQDAISVNITLLAGAWRVSVLAGANFAHDGGSTIDRRVQLGANNGSTFTATMTTTREQYATRHRFDNVAGEQALTAKLQYKVADGGSGVASCRAPWIVVVATRMGDAA